MADLFGKDDQGPEKFTEPHNERMRGYIAATRPGMAHWCGSGPAGRTCRECVHYENKGYYVTGSMVAGGMLKPGRCRKHKDMMNGKWGRPFPWHVAACRFFDESPDIPPKRSK